jgi:hypothetical protein
MEPISNEDPAVEVSKPEPELPKTARQQKTKKNTISTDKVLPIVNTIYLKTMERRGERTSKMGLIAKLERS